MKARKVILILICVGLLAYANSLLNGFVWDDDLQILKNDPLHSISNFPKFFTGGTFYNIGSGQLYGLYYKPLLTSFFSLVYSIFGPNAFFFHLLQIGLHLVNGVLVFLLFKHFLKEKVAFFLSLIFLVHPINTEAVVYISALQDPLFFFFGILAFHMVVKQPTLSFRKISLTSFLLLLSLFSKETGILFLGTTLVYVFLFARKNLLFYLSGSAFILTIYFIFRFGLAGLYLDRALVITPMTLNLHDRLLTIPKIVLFYLKTFTFPKDLAIAQVWLFKGASFADFYLPLIVSITFFLAILILTMLLWRRHKEQGQLFVFFLCWFLLGLGLSLQIFPLDMMVAERWFYFPIVGVLGIIGTTLESLKVKNLRLKYVSVVFAFLIILALSARTVVRNSNWKDHITLYSHDIKVSKESFYLENNLGAALLEIGKYDEAKVHFENAIKLFPQYSTAFANLGLLAFKDGQIEEAKQYFQIAIEKGLSPGKYHIYERLAYLLLLDEDAKSILDFAESSLKKFPKSGRLWAVFAIAHYRLGNRELALKAAKRAYALFPNKDNLYIIHQIEKNQPIKIISGVEQ